MSLKYNYFQKSKEEMTIAKMLEDNIVCRIYTLLN